MSKSEQPSGPRQRELFLKALEKPTPAERAAFLDGACGDDTELRTAVEALLANHREDSFLEQPAVSGTGTVLMTSPNDEQVGTIIGRYKLLEKLGEGGFGAVWAAEQKEPVRRRVALKIIKLGMDTKQVVARFEAERQALAMMDHPNIARVLDAGATDKGRPYFVMELVRGVRITDYCDQNGLSTRERLDLFIKVCHAIQHAHQKGIIHRDIKPSNVLVTLHDGVPVPKVIDFGIAKATQAELTEKTIYTQYQQFIGTPAYMSPEQAEMSGLDLDTRSDIYSLGVLLYELLTGKPPFDPDRLLASGIDEMRRILREVEPLRPSTALSTMAMNDATTLAKARKMTAPALANLIRGDLDWIVMKSLEKDRARRYETANALAADIQRHLTDEPVVARPPSTMYRFSRLIRRNKLAFAAAGAVTAALLIGLFVASWQAVRATRAEQAARHQSERARADRDRAVRAEADARVQAVAAKAGWGAARGNAYVVEINVALQALAENNLGRARDLLDRQRPKAGQVDLRGFEWRYLWQQCQGDELETFHDEGEHGAAFSPDGKLFAYSGGKIFVREAASRKLVATLESSATTLSFSPTAKLLASAHDSEVKLWDTETWLEVRSLPDTTHGCRFSPDGRWLVTGASEGWRLWNTQTWEPAGDCPGGPRARWLVRNAVAFSPDSQFLVTGWSHNRNEGNHLRVWRLPHLEQLPAIPFEVAPGSLAFSADGQHLILGLFTGEIVVLDFAGRKVVKTLQEHTASVTAVAVAPKGKVFATTSADRTINVWDAATFKLLVRLRGHVGEVWSGAISPDGSTVVSGSTEGVAKLWSANARHTDTVLDGGGILMGFFGGGRHLVVDWTNSVSVWTPETGARMDFETPNNMPTLNGITTKTCDVKPDEPLYALGRVDGSMELRDLTSGAKVAAWQAHDESVGAVKFSRDGKRFATGSIKGDVKIWDSAHRREVTRIGPVDRHIMCLTFSEDGKSLAGSGVSSRVWVWDVDTGRPLVELGGHGDEYVGSVAFAPDGKLLATTTVSANEARLWELPSGRQIATLKGHVQGLTGVEFSPDGKTLVTVSYDRKVKLWSVSTHQELVTFPFNTAYQAVAAHFTPDGRALAISWLDARGSHTRVVRAPSFEEIAAAERTKPKM
jgi:WD40 repeat protein/serine/threonine protein kinase